MAMAGANPSDGHPGRGKVGRDQEPGGIHHEKFKGTKKVCQEFLVREDGALAHRLQEEEFGYKYEFNRNDRRTARVDVPKAKILQSAEEERIQRERMEHLEKQHEIAQRDARMAEEVYTQMMLEEQDKRRRSEIQDQELARKLQDQEKERHERKQRERELLRERKRIERDVERTTKQVLAEYQTEASPDPQDNVDSSMDRLRLTGSRHEKLLRYDGRVEDLGDFSDFYIQPSDGLDPNAKRELQRVQDEELARLLQEQEHKRGAVVNKDKLKVIEAQDEELARVIQEQEKLRLEKHKQKQAQRQMSQPAIVRAQQARHPPVERGRSLPEGYRTGPPRYQDPPDYHDPPVYANVGLHNANRNSSGSDEVYQTPRAQPVMQPGRGSPPQRNGGLDYGNGAPSPPPTARHNRQQSGDEAPWTNRPSQPSNQSSPAHHSPSNSNVIAAIDPTFANSTLDSSSTERSSSQLSQISPPPTLTRAMPPGLEGHGTYEEQWNNEPPAGGRSPGNDTEGYVDLNDIQPVPGQRRTSTGRKKSGSKSSKDKNCKQQ